MTGLQSYKKRQQEAVPGEVILHIWEKIRNFVAAMANKDNLSDKMLRLTLRLSHGRLSASVGDPQSLGSIVYEPYEMNNGISPAANLREAFQRSELLKSGYRRALILNDAPVLIIPEEEYVAEEADTLYRYTFRTGGSDEVVCRQLPALNGVAALQ